MHRAYALRAVDLAEPRPDLHWDLDLKVALFKSGDLRACVDPKRENSRLARPLTAALRTGPRALRNGLRRSQRGACSLLLAKIPASFQRPTAVSSVYKPDGCE